MVRKIQVGTFLTRARRFSYVEKSRGYDRSTGHPVPTMRTQLATEVRYNLLFVRR